MKTEIEIKLRIADPAAFIARLERLGARLALPRTFEDNQLYDFPDRSLARRGAMLRLRTHERGGLLTYKEGARIEAGAKVRDEVEVALDESAPMTVIIERLGMTPLFRYQKYRTSYAYGDLHITLDETPIGIFAELEGPKARIDAAARRLGFAASEYILGSYRDLYVESLGGREDAAGELLFVA